MAQIICDYSVLESNHPNHLTIKKKGIGGSIEHFMNTPDANGQLPETCCIELCYAMNRAGLDIASNYGYSSNEVSGGRVRAITGGDGFRYIFAVPDMKVYLDGRYNNTENYRGSSKKSLTNEIEGRKGIISLGHRHIDLWDGQNYHLNRTGTILPLWNDPSTQKRGIFFWEVLSLNDFLQKEYGS
jgi:hypothetical protein